MKIISWNVNGARSVSAKGFLGWLGDASPDILCLQETRLDPSSVPPELSRPFGYRTYWSFAKKKGYSGVAIMTKFEPDKVESGIGMKRFDDEGRSLVLEFDDFVLYNLYFPHGGRQKENMPYKLKAFDHFLRRVEKINKPAILCGDFNVAREDADLARPKDNRNNTMFTQEERERMGKIIGSGFVDTFRERNREGGNYTWWPFANDARRRNIGWRIDYVLVSRKLKGRVKDAFILRETKGSDHCPVGVTIF